MTRLDIISDPICPWCYIGIANLMRALDLRPEHPFLIRWRPYFLNPDMPRDGVDRLTYLEMKFGGRDGIAKAHAPIVEAAEAAGLPLNLSAIARTPNTLDAHRMIHWAEAEGVQSRVALSLFRAYFEKGEDISDRDVLLRIANSSGCDGTVIARLLAGDADRATVAEAGAAAAGMGVTGVPTFILGGRYVVAGAQPAELWIKVIDELAVAVATMSGTRAE